MTLNQLLSRNQHLTTWAECYRDQKNQYWIISWDPELHRAEYQGRMDDPGNVVLEQIQTYEVPQSTVVNWATGETQQRPHWF